MRLLYFDKLIYIELVIFIKIGDFAKKIRFIFSLTNRTTVYQVNYR